MVIKARINEEQMFRLCSWSSGAFAGDPTLRLQTDDLRGVKELFSDIWRVEIFVNDNLAGEYVQYDSYESISYEGTVFVEHENIFADCMRVTLRRSSLVDEVARIEEIVSPTYDIDSMTAGEYRNYLLKQISNDCRNEIYHGTQVQLSDGTVEYYTYDAEDQQNLVNAVAMIVITPDMPAYPYHPSGGICRMMSAVDILEIYVTLQLYLIDKSTKCNLMNNWLKSIDNKEDMLEISWDTELPENYQEQWNEIHEQALEIMNAFRDKYIKE